MPNIAKPTSPDTSPLGPNSFSARVPPEILSKIIATYVDRQCADFFKDPIRPALESLDKVEDRDEQPVILGICVQEAFARLASLLAASSVARRCALARFFRTFDVASREGDYLIDVLVREDEKGLEKMDKDSSRPFGWVRKLVSTTYMCTKKPELLQLLTGLESLTLFCHREEQGSCMTVLRPIFDHITGHCGWLQHQMTELTLSCVRQVDKETLQNVASTFPNLNRLSISVTDGVEMHRLCCIDCYLEQAVELTGHSPIPDNQKDLHDIISGFGRTLQALTHLKHLHVGIFLSGDKLGDVHFEHAPMMHKDVSTMYGISACPKCSRFLDSTKEREIRASLIMARCIPSLETVSWSSVFRQAPEDYGVYGLDLDTSPQDSAPDCDYRLLDDEDQVSVSAHLPRRGQKEGLAGTRGKTTKPQTRGGQARIIRIFNERPSYEISFNVLRSPTTLAVQRRRLGAHIHGRSPVA